MAGAERREPWARQRWRRRGRRGTRNTCGAGSGTRHASPCKTARSPCSAAPWEPEGGSRCPERTAASREAAHWEALQRNLDCSTPRQRTTGRSTAILLAVRPRPSAFRCGRARLCSASCSAAAETSTARAAARRRARCSAPCATPRIATSARRARCGGEAVEGGSERTNRSSG